MSELINKLALQAFVPINAISSKGVADWYTFKQTWYIECTKEKDEHCGMELSLNADFWDIRNAEDVLTEAWNKLDRK